MKESPEKPNYNPELVFRHIIFNREWDEPGFAPFTIEDVKKEWREITGDEPPDTIEESVETLVERGMLYKHDDGAYQEAAF